VDLLLKVIMTTYVVVGISVLFAMLGNVIWWKSEKVDNFIYPTFLGWGVTGAIITVTLLLMELWNGGVNVCTG
jgi:hypothetical protein